ncbi:hypothetical protein BDA99DRAFT_508417 [Phascolomyces articulosus]|uniref:Uncharacterized protein n=1 Tax=Phascolomyces articulosus TaxID=60185 RepID=A0AAD5PEG9_9FUNG|nr:hypothetical protein BDA99DRAFT_508417 [Phascolomyces articulosus]
MADASLKASIWSVLFHLFFFFFFEFTQYTKGYRCNVVVLTFLLSVLQTATLDKIYLTILE